jgi:cytochrome c556
MSLARVAAAASALLAAGACVALLGQDNADIKPRPVGTMSELMINIIYPTSDSLFYISRGAPENEKAWNDFQAQMLTLAESANLLMDQRAQDKGKWMADAKLLLDVGQKAFKLAKAKDAMGLEALNAELYNACVTCHEDYRPRYGKRPR